MQGECGQDLSQSRRRGKIFCNDEEYDCMAKRKEFPFMVRKLILDLFRILHFEMLHIFFDKLKLTMIICRHC